MEREFGGLDIFVANAGVWPAEEVRLGDMPVERWRSTMQANLDSVFLSTRAVLPLMRPGGRVVIVSSTAGQRGEAFHADYAATKGALISLTKSLAIEYAPEPRGQLRRAGLGRHRDERAGLHPGRTASASGRASPSAASPRAEDIAGPILFLCSDLARHVTGEVLNVNGGSVLCG